MPMPKGDAVYLNVILRWMVGDVDITTEHAYAAARELAERVRRVLQTGVQPIAVVQCARLADRPHSTHVLLAGMLAECWAAAEGDGSWPGRTVVDIVARAMTAHGYDMRHPRETSRSEEWTPELLRGIALTRARNAAANTVTHAASTSSDGVIPE